MYVYMCIYIYTYIYIYIFIYVQLYFSLESNKLFKTCETLSKLKNNSCCFFFCGRSCCKNLKISQVHFSSNRIVPSPFLKGDPRNISKQSGKEWGLIFLKNWPGKLKRGRENTKILWEIRWVFFRFIALFIFN